MREVLFANKNGGPAGKELLSPPSPPPSLFSHFLFKNTTLKTAGEEEWGRGGEGGREGGRERRPDCFGVGVLSVPARVMVRGVCDSMTLEFILKNHSLDGETLPVRN